MTTQHGERLGKQRASSAGGGRRTPRDPHPDCRCDEDERCVLPVVPLDGLVLRPLSRWQARESTGCFQNEGHHFTRLLLHHAGDEMRRMDELDPRHAVGCVAGGEPCRRRPIRFCKSGAIETRGRHNGCDLMPQGSLQPTHSPFSDSPGMAMPWNPAEGQGRHIPRWNPTESCLWSSDGMGVGKHSV